MFCFTFLLVKAGNITTSRLVLVACGVRWFPYCIYIFLIKRLNSRCYCFAACRLWPVVIL